MTHRIQGKFYALTPEVCQKLRKGKLTGAEWRIWSYLVEKDPYGDRYMDVDTLEVISECNVSKATFYRASAKFQEMGLFDFQDKGFSFKNENGVSKMRQQSQKCDNFLKNETGSLKNETTFSKMRLGVSKMRLTNSETLSEQGFKNLSDIKTYSEFTDSLSEDEREKFLAFVSEQIENLPKPVNDVSEWLASRTKAGENRWQVYYQKFINSKQSLDFAVNNVGQKHRDIVQEIEQRRLELLQLHQTENESIEDDR